MIPTAAAIKFAVAAQWEVTVLQLDGPRRPKRLAEARQAAMWLMRKLRKDSLPVIGEQLGGRDHSTIIHGINRIQRRAAESAYMRDRLTEVGLALGLGRIALPKAVRLVPEYVPPPKPNRYVLSRDRVRAKRVRPHPFGVAIVRGRPVDWADSPGRIFDRCAVCGHIRKGHNEASQQQDEKRAA